MSASDQDNVGPEADILKQKLAELVRAQRPAPGPKLSFAERCAAFLALRAHVEPRIVGRAFGVTAGAISMLKNCMTKHRYLDVRREWERMGEDIFFRTYYTEEIQRRLALAAAEIAAGEDARINAGANGRADKFAFCNFNAFRCGDDYWRIDWTPGEGGRHLHWLDGRGGPGWRYVDCQPDGQPVERDFELGYAGREMLIGGEPAPFRTSKHVHSAIIKAVEG